MRGPAWASAMIGLWAPRPSRIPTTSAHAWRTAARSLTDRQAGCEVVQIDVVVPKKLSARRRASADRRADTGQRSEKRARQAVHRVHQVVQAGEINRRLRDALPAPPVGPDVTSDDRSRQLGRAHRGSRGEIAQDGRVRPAGSRLDLFGANQHARVITDLPGDLEHRHEAGIHADEVDLASQQSMPGGEHPRRAPGCRGNRPDRSSYARPNPTGSSRPMPAGAERSTQRPHLLGHVDARPVVPDDQRIALGRIGAHAEGQELLKHVRVARVRFAEIRQQVDVIRRRVLPRVMW